MSKLGKLELSCMTKKESGQVLGQIDGQTDSNS